MSLTKRHGEGHGKLSVRRVSTKSTARCATSCSATVSTAGAHTATSRPTPPVVERTWSITEERGLKWYHTDKDVTPNVQRGFCQECGSSVFWDPRGQEFVYISAGSLDAPTGVKGAGHIWLSEAGDYYEVHDGLPRAEGSSHGRFLV